MMPDPSALLRQLGALIAEADPAALPDLIGELEGAKAAAWARLLTRPGPGAGTADPVADENLGIAEAARRLGVSAQWLYKNARKLPFAVRIGRRVVFSASGLARWNRQRQGR